MKAEQPLTFREGQYVLVLTDKAKFSKDDDDGNLTLMR
jgi:hypothetical protein